MNDLLPGLPILNNLPDWNGRDAFGLSAVEKALGALQRPQDRPKTVHVAGTNGKGSVAAAVATILRAEGYRVGLVTSPHLIRINERILLDGEEISDENLSDCIVAVNQAAVEAGVTLSKHELLTAASFVAVQDLDFAVIEVGLGGRLDASNVLSHPDAAAIVTIDYDHEDVLGGSLAAIAEEKAGIIKPHAKLIVGALPPEALTVVSRAAERQAAVQLTLGQDFIFSEHRCGEYVYRDSSVEINYRPSLRGNHQGHNMAVAIAIARSLGVSIDACISGVSSVQWPGRLEVQQIGREVLYDCAHNPAGMRSLISFLESSGRESIDVIFGVFAAKRWKEMVDLLAPFIVNWGIVEPHSTRALAVEHIGNYLSELGIPFMNYRHDYSAAAAEAMRNVGRPLLVTGSMSIVGAMRSLLLCKTTV